VQCVFKHEAKLFNGSLLVEEGYDHHHGPSPLCTGGVTNTRSSLLWSVIAMAFWHAAASS
jgi:hypothetical protein